MSEKDSRPPRGKGGKSFGSKGGRPPGRGFGDKKPSRFEGDKPSRGRPARAEGGFKPKRDFGDRPARSRDGDSDRAPRSFGDRPKRDFGDRPKRDFGDRPARSRDSGGFGDRPKRDFGDRPKRDFGDRPKRDFGDRPPRREEGGFSDRPKRDFGDRPKRDFGDRPKRDFGDRPPRREEGGFGDRPKRDFGDRPKRDFSDRPKREYGDKPLIREDRPKREYGDRPDRRPSGPRTGEGKTFQRNFDRTKTYPTKAPRGVPRNFEEAGRDYAGASEETNLKLKSGRPSHGGPSASFLYGHHAVRSALLNPKRMVQRLIVTEESFENVREAYDQAQEQGLRRPEPTYVDREDIDRLLPRDAVHQDVLLDSQHPEEVFLADLLISAPENAKIIILDQVTDPHNVGAILRSAAAFGAIAVIAQKLHAPDITGTLAKIASGAAEIVPIIRETNLSRAIEQLKDAGFFCIGLDERGKQTIAQAKIEGKVALVMGAEGDGLRRLVAEKCDVLAQLPTSGPIASLNVSNAAAVALYELIRT